MRLPVRAVIYFYIFICVVLLLFNLLYIFRSGSVKRRQKRRVHRWETYLDSFLEGRPVWDSGELLRRLKDTEELIAFYAAMESRKDTHPEAAARFFQENRPLVLELAPRGLCLQITEKGAKEETVSYWELSQEGKSHTLFRDKTEKYDYFCKLQPGLASYSILETAESLQAFWENVCKLPNVLGGVGLYQELAPFFEPK